MSDSPRECRPWRIAAEGLVLGEEVLISFQRFSCPPRGWVEQPPSSLGPLPVGADSRNELLLPLALGEAVWLGLTALPPASAPELAVVAETRANGLFEAANGHAWNGRCTAPITVSGYASINGVFRDDYTAWAFQRDSLTPQAPACEAILFQLHQPERQGGIAAPAENAPVRLRCVSYENFSAETGNPPPSPLDPGAAYGGWLMS